MGASHEGGDRDSDTVPNVYFWPLAECTAIVVALACVVVFQERESLRSLFFSDRAPVAAVPASMSIDASVDQKAADTQSDAEKVEEARKERRHTTAKQ